MCFSASASFVAGTALSAIGALTIRKAKKKAELPFAAIPLLFGIQQLSEGMVWLSFRPDLSFLNLFFTYFYSFFALIFWPIFIPVAVGLLETEPSRKKVFYLLRAIGVLTGSTIFYFHTLNPATSAAVGKNIAYGLTHPYGLWLTGLYFISTVGSCLLSSRKIVRLFGGLAFLSAVLAYQFYAASFASVWCFFAAVLSALIYSAF